MSKKQGGINISRSSVKVNGDMVGRDKVVTHAVQTKFAESILLWEKDMHREVDSVNLPADEKDDIKKQLTTIKSTLVDDEENPTRLEKMLNTLALMSPDIFDVTLATLANPLAGIGLTLRKISDKAKLEKQAQ